MRQAWTVIHRWAGLFMAAFLVCLLALLPRWFTCSSCGGFGKSAAVVSSMAEAAAVSGAGVSSKPARGAPAAPSPCGKCSGSGRLRILGKLGK